MITITKHIIIVTITYYNDYYILLNLLLSLLLFWVSQGLGGAQSYFHWAVQRFVYTIDADIFQGLGPKRRRSCDGDRVYDLCALPSETPGSAKPPRFLSLSLSLSIYIYIYV